MFKRIIFAAVICMASTLSAAPAVPDAATKHTINLKPDNPKSPTLDVYTRMTQNGLIVETLPGKSVDNGDTNTYLRLPAVGAPLYINRTYTFAAPEDFEARDSTGCVALPELADAPGLITYLEKYEPFTVRFRVNKPVRVYAYINWEWTNHDNAEREQWSFYRLDSRAASPVYYRDFPAGEHAMNFYADHVAFVAVRALDSLSPQEQVIPIGLVGDGKPILRIWSDHDKPVEAAVTYEAIDPGDGTVADTGTAVAMLQPHRGVGMPLTLTKLTEGVMYFIKVTVVAAGRTWVIDVPHGLFPPPPPDASVQEPILPYGGYIKLQVNGEPEIYNRFLAATFYHFRKMHMNAAVLGIPKKNELDLAQQYHIKAIIRLGSVTGREQYAPRELVEHPAVLTYMVGDEPKVGPKLDAHKELFESLTKQYPQYKPVTATIFDSWGTGDVSDPCRIYNEHLADYDMIRFGRFYCFQKLEYGLLNPISYKPRIGAQATFLGLEADTKRPWWIAPQFFGTDKPGPIAYWRIPSGREMAAMMHMAMAHRCSGIIGWGTHTHGNCYGLCFDGYTMAPTEKNANAALGRFGEQIMRAKPVIQAFSTKRIQLQKHRPYQLDAAGRWLTDGRVAIYAVNRDLEEAHPTEIWWYLGDKVKGKSPKFADPYAFYDEIASATDAFTGSSVAVDKQTMENGRFVFARFTFDSLGPGEAALIVVDGKGDAGRFRDEVLTPDLRELVGDQAYANID